MAEAKAKDMEGIQRQKTKNSNILSNIDGFEKRVEKNFDKHKYDGIKMCYNDAFIDDPIRIIRAIRFTRWH